MHTTQSHFAIFGRSILSSRKNQVISMDTTNNTDQDSDDLELFQKHISDRFLSLPGDSFLSINWVSKLLDVFLCCETEFKSILTQNSSNLNKPHLDRLIHELLDRTVKSLDICNAITNSIESIHQWRKIASIVVSALHDDEKNHHHHLGEGQIRRAIKALNSLHKAMKINGKDESIIPKIPERAWSFGRRVTSSPGSVSSNFRSNSWNLSRNWSASKQIQAMSMNLMVPRGCELIGLGLPIYIMSIVLVFVMWSLVIAIPCQDRNGLANQFQIPRQLSWTFPILGLQDRIVDEWKKNKGSIGLLEEISRLEKCTKVLIELTDSVQFPVNEEQGKKIKVEVIELSEICRNMEEGLGPLQKQIREVYRRIVETRSEVLHLLELNGKCSSSIL